MAIKVIKQRTGYCAYRQTENIFRELCRIFGLTPPRSCRPGKVLSIWAESKAHNRTGLQSAIVQEAIQRQKKRAKERERAKNEAQRAEWRRDRYRIFQKQGNRCQLCGRTPQHGVPLQIDDNLQVVCEDCSAGRGDVAAEG